MLHEHVPITKDSEVCCASCGVVLDSVQQNYDRASFTQTAVIGGESIYPGLDTMMVGMSLEQTINWHFQKNKELVNKQRVLSRLLDITKLYVLPDRIAYETMRRLLKKKRGLYSYKIQVRELLDVLAADYRYIYKYRAIKDKYESVNGI